jgi:hypothetical protein
MIKEKIVKQAIAKAEKKIEFLKNEIFNNDPISKQIEVHKKFAQFLEEKKGVARLTKESINYIDELNRDMELHKKRQKTYNSSDLMKNLIIFEKELRELLNEKFDIDQTNKSKT